MRCSGGGAFACYSVLAALIAAALALGGAAAQDGTRTWLLTRAYNASGQQLFEQFSAAPGNIVFSPYSIGTAMAMALAGARGETEREMIGVLQHRLDRPEIDAVNAIVLSILNSYDRSTTTPACPEGMRLNARVARARCRRMVNAFSRRGAKAGSASPRPGIRRRPSSSSPTR